MKKVLSLISIIGFLSITYYSANTFIKNESSVLKEKSEVSKSMEKSLPLMIFDIFQVYVN